MSLALSTDGNYSYNVFINCPFDKNYLPRLKVLIFVVRYLGFIPRCALEIVGNDRLVKIKRIISECRYGIHDISRIGGSKSGHPRFNMPFELGLDIGCSAFGNEQQKKKLVLVLDTVPHRYQKVISDLNGVDPVIYDPTMHGIISAVRDWLIPEVPEIPAGGNFIYKDYLRFRKDEARLREKANFDSGKAFKFNEHSFLISKWLKDNA